MKKVILFASFSILSLACLAPLSSCMSLENVALDEKDRLISLKTDTFSLNEPLMMSAKGEGENWVGLFSPYDDLPIYWEYLSNVGCDVQFDLKSKNKGFYHNGFEDLRVGEFYLKWFEKDSNVNGEEKYKVKINFVDAPLLKPISFDYKLKDKTTGYADGLITVKSDKRLINNASITMFWANRKGKLVDYNALARFEITKEIQTYEMPGHILIPKGATALHIYSSRHFNLSNEYLTFDLPADILYKDLGNLKFAYTVCSDTQLGPNIKGYEYVHLEEMYKDILSQDYDNQGILINGDVADHGQKVEYDNMMSIYNKYPDLPNMYLAIGNHELQYGTNQEKRDELEALFLQYAFLPDGTHPSSINYDFWHNGYHFIMVGNDKLDDSHEINLNENSLTWFKNALAENYDPHRPCFIFMHQPIHNTVAGSLKSQGWNGVRPDTEVKIKEVLKDYPKAILFTGHTHWVLNSFQNIYADDPNLPRCVNTAAVAYEWTTYGNLYGGGANHTGAEGYIMEIYEDNLVLRGRDYLNHKWQPSSYYCFEY